MYEAMIRSGADVNEPDEDGNTHLINTAGGGHVKCVNLLLKAGADVNKHGKDGINCIDRVRLGMDMAIVVKLLLDAGADVNARSCTRQAQHLVVLHANSHLDCLKILIQAGTDINACCQCTRTQH